MIINEISEQQCRAVLSRAKIVRLGCALENQPYVVPVFVVCEADYLYVFSTLGQKIEWMRANPKVCLQVDEISDQSHWTSVVVNGTYQELSESLYPAERAHARKLLENRERWWLTAVAERRVRVSDIEVEPIFFRIHIESVSGVGAIGESDVDVAASPRGGIPAISTS